MTIQASPREWWQAFRFVSDPRLAQGVLISTPEVSTLDVATPKFHARSVTQPTRWGRGNSGRDDPLGFMGAVA